MLTLSNGNTLVIGAVLLDASPSLCALVDTGEAPHPATQRDAAQAYAAACARLDAATTKAEWYVGPDWDSQIHAIAQ